MREKFALTQEKQWAAVAEGDSHRSSLDGRGTGYGIKGVTVPL